MHHCWDPKQKDPRRSLTQAKSHMKRNKSISRKSFESTRRSLNPQEDFLDSIRKKRDAYLRIYRSKSKFSEATTTMYIVKKILKWLGGP